MHLVTTPLNIFFSKLDAARRHPPRSRTSRRPRRLGISKLEEFSWKRRLDFDACVECGRCQDVCPAYLAGTRAVAQAGHREAQAPPARRARRGRSTASSSRPTSCGPARPAWRACRSARPSSTSWTRSSTCGATSRSPRARCRPRRRSRSRTSSAPGNPWGLPAERAAGVGGGARRAASWSRARRSSTSTGSAAPRRTTSATRPSRASVVTILKTAGVSFAVMQEERCHGEVARRLGEEYLYQTRARRERRGTSSSTSSRRSSRTARTASTRSRTSSRSSAATYEVLHHSVVIDELHREGRITPTKPRGRPRGLPRLLLPRPLQRHHGRAAARACARCRASSVDRSAAQPRARALLRRRRRPHVDGDPGARSA